MKMLVSAFISVYFCVQCLAAYSGGANEAMPTGSAEDMPMLVSQADLRAYCLERVSKVTIGMYSGGSTERNQFVQHEAPYVAGPYGPNQMEILDLVAEQGSFDVKLANPNDVISVSVALVDEFGHLLFSGGSQVRMEKGQTGGSVSAAIVFRMADSVPILLNPHAEWARLIGRNSSDEIVDQRNPGVNLQADGRKVMFFPKAYAGRRGQLVLGSNSEPSGQLVIDTATGQKIGVGDIELLTQSYFEGMYTAFDPETIEIVAANPDLVPVWQIVATEDLEEVEVRAYTSGLDMEEAKTCRVRTLGAPIAEQDIIDLPWKGKIEKGTYFFIPVFERWGKHLVEEPLPPVFPGKG